MSFIQTQLDKISNQTRDIFDTYIYKTSDTCAEVEAAGYFDESRFAASEPEQWSDGIIEIQCSDGFGKGFLDSNLDFSFSIGGAASAFCPILSLTNYDNGDPQTVVINPATNQVTVTAPGVVNNSNSAQIGSASFTTATETVAVESTFDSSNQGANAFVVSCGFVDSNSAGAVAFAGIGISPSLGVTIDAVTAVPIDFGLIVPDGTAIMAELDSNTGTASYTCDSLGVSGSLTVDGSYSNVNPVFMGGSLILSTPAALNDDGVYTFNAGYKAFTNTTTAKRHCEV